MLLYDYLCYKRFFCYKRVEFRVFLNLSFYYVFKIVFRLFKFLRMNLLCKVIYIYVILFVNFGEMRYLVGD